MHSLFIELIVIIDKTLYRKKAEENENKELIIRKNIHFLINNKN